MFVNFKLSIIYLDGWDFRLRIQREYNAHTICLQKDRDYYLLDDTVVTVLSKLSRLFYILPTRLVFKSYMNSTTFWR